MAQKTEGPARPPANLPIGDDDTFARATMQDALQKALEKAGKKSVADIPTVEATPVAETAPSNPLVAETTPPAPPELPPDSELEDYVNGVKKDYLDLATDIRSYRTASIERLDPQRDLPTEWGAAYATFNNVQTFTKDYRKEKDPTKKAQILKKIQLNGDKDLWQRIYDGVSTGLQRLQAEPIPEAPAAPEVPQAKAPPVEPVKVPPAAPATPEAAAPLPEVTPPATSTKKPPAARATHEKKKKRVPVKEKVASVAASTPAPREAPELTPEREALAKAVAAVTSKTPEAGAKPAERTKKEAFRPKALLTNINHRYDELAEEMKAEHIEPAEVLFAMRPVSAIEARLQTALDARKATKNPTARAVAEREARAAYDELMGPATMAVHEAIGRKRASRDALEVSEAEGAPAETLESSEPLEGSVAAKTLAQPVEKSAADTLESSPVPPGSVAADMLAQPIVVGPEREQMPHINERIEKAQQALVARSAELDKKAEGLGSSVTRSLRALGEGYNKLSWKKKVAFGLALGAVGVGGSLTGGFGYALLALPLAWRGVGSVGAFVAVEGLFQRSYEKKEKWWNKYPKAPAALAAALVASGLVGKGIGLVADSTGVSGWLKAHWPFGSGAPEHPAPGVKAPGVPPPAPSSGLPVTSVEVKPGYGYESMIRELAGQLKGQNPNLYPTDSDAYRLLNARPERFNSVILQIEKEHGFVKPDGSSAVVGLGSRMSFDAQGRLIPENTLAPRGAVAAPEVSPRAGAVVAPPIERGPTATDLNKQELSRIKAGLPAAMPGENVIGPNASVVPGPENLVPPPATAPYPTAPFVNHFNVPIDPTQGGIYQGPNNALIAFANDPARAMAAAETYARAHHRVLVWVQAPEPYMDQGVPRPYAIPVEHRGFFGGGMHHGTLPPNTPPPKDWMGAMNPNIFTKRLS